MGTENQIPLTTPRQAKAPKKKFVLSGWALIVVPLLFWALVVVLVLSNYEITGGCWNEDHLYYYASTNPNISIEHFCPDGWRVTGAEVQAGTYNEAVITPEPKFSVFESGKVETTFTTTDGEQVTVYGETYDRAQRSRFWMLTIGGAITVLMFYFGAVLIVRERNLKKDANQQNIE